MEIHALISLVCKKNLHNFTKHYKRFTADNPLQKTTTIILHAST